jgi:predicted nucleic acid-binding protein
MRFLVDTSALTRLLRQQADSGWDRLEDRGLLSVCEPVLAEKPPGCVSRRAAFAFRG